MCRDAQMPPRQMALVRTAGQGEIVEMPSPAGRSGYYGRRPCLFPAPRRPEARKQAEGLSGLLRLLKPPELHLVDFRGHHRGAICRFRGLCSGTGNLRRRSASASRTACSIACRSRAASAAVKPVSASRRRRLSSSIWMPAASARSRSTSDRTSTWSARDNAALSLPWRRREHALGLDLFAQ
jgi:hypothetical protein